MSDRQPVLVAALAIGLVSVATALGTGLLSFTGGVDHDIDDDSCQVTGQHTFECGGELGAVVDTPREVGQVTSGIYGDENIGTALDEYPDPVLSFLKSRDVVFEDSTLRIDSEKWTGRCTVTAPFVSDSGERHVVEMEGELVGGSSFECRTSESPESVDFAVCPGSEVECRDEITGRYGLDEFTGGFSVEYELRQDSDGDGVLDRNDDCPEESGERADGCPVKDSEPVAPPTDDDGGGDESDGSDTGGESGGNGLVSVLLDLVSVLPLVSIG